MTTMPRPIYETKEDKDIDLAHLFDTFINNRLLILGITGFFAALGIAYALLATPVYLASAMIQIEPKNGLPSLTDVVNTNPPVFGGWWCRFQPESRHQHHPASLPDHRRLHGASLRAERRR